MGPGLRRDGPLRARSLLMLALLMLADNRHWKSHDKLASAAESLAFRLTQL
jgi:hypothetical protein